MHLAPGTSIVAEIDEIPASTRWHRAHGRQTRRERAIKQQLLTPQEEKALVDYALQQHRNGHALRVKHLRHFAGVILRRRGERSADEASNDRIPGKDWPKAFCDRHPEIEAARRKAIESDRDPKKILPKCKVWFDMMGKQLNERGIQQENVYNMDETDVILGQMDTVKVLVARGDKEHRRARAAKRTMITAVECVSADGRCLNPFIIFPGKNVREPWVMCHETPGWHCGVSEKGYNVSSLNLYWLQKVFHPATQDRANSRPRVLIIDGFGSHEAVDVLVFCMEQNIVLCRQPSHSTHKTQPLDVGVFSALKTAYRDQVDILYRNGAETVNKNHFTLLYDRARKIAMTSRNIRSGWSRAGLYPFNPAKVLDTMQAIPAEANAEFVTPPVRLPLQPLVSPALRTPTNAMSLAALELKIGEKKAAALDIDPYYQKIINAAKQALAGKGILEDENGTLRQQNNEKKVREKVKDRKVGQAKAYSYEDVVEAVQARDRKDAEKARRKTEREKKNAEKQAKKDAKQATNKVKGSQVVKAKKPRAKRPGANQPESSSQAQTQASSGHARLPTDDASLTIWDRSSAAEVYDNVTVWQAPVAVMY